MSFNRIVLAAIVSAATTIAFANPAALEGGQADVHTHGQSTAAAGKTQAQVRGEAREFQRSTGLGVWEGGEAGSQMLPGQALAGADTAQSRAEVAAARDQLPASTAVYEGGEASGPVHQHAYTNSGNGRVVHAR